MKAMKNEIFDYGYLPFISRVYSGRYGWVLVQDNKRTLDDTGVRHNAGDALPGTRQRILRHAENGQGDNRG